MSRTSEANKTLIFGKSFRLVKENNITFIFADKSLFLCSPHVQTLTHKRWCLLTYFAKSIELKWKDSPPIIVPIEVWHPSTANKSDKGRSTEYSQTYESDTDCISHVGGFRLLNHSAFSISNPNFQYSDHGSARPKKEKSEARSSPDTRHTSG